MKIQGFKNKKSVVRVLSFVLFVVAIVVLTAMLLPFFLSLYAPEKMEEFKGYIDSLGVWGMLLLAGIQVLQIVVALIPGEVVEFAAGVLYGPIGGLFICLFGSFVGTAIVFFAVRKFGYPLLTTFFHEDKLKKYKFLHDEKKLEYITFIFFIIPGTPKDIFTYFAGLTTINPTSFIIIATFARIPSIITSTYAGSEFENGDIFTAIVIYVITVLVSGLGFLLNKYLEDKRNKKKLKELSDSEIEIVNEDIE